MPVPNSMSDLATLAGSNFPTGTEAIGNSLDNYIRAISAILRSTNALASATIAAASTTDVGAADGEVVQVTGSATINSFGVGFLGCRRELRFSGACTLVNGANIVLGGANIVTVAGDAITFRCTASGVWSIAGVGNGIRRTGDRMYGSFDVGASGNPITRLHFGGGNQVWLSALDSTGTNLTADLWYRAATHTWTNSSGSTTVTLDGSGGFQVGGEVRVGSLGNGAARIVASSGNVFWDSRQVIGTNLPNANAFYRAAIHTWTNGSGSNIASLDGSGNFTANGNVTGGSDERVKTNWRDLPGDFVERLASVKHGIYDRTDIGATQAGVGAQSLRDKVLPELVHEADDGFLSVAYGNAGLLGSIAVAQRLLALESRVRALEVE